MAKLEWKWKPDTDKSLMGNVKKASCQVDQVHHTTTQDVAVNIGMIRQYDFGHSCLRLGWSFRF